MCGSLGKPSKMPGLSYGLSAFKCRTGGKLAEIPGSVCHKCYAQRGHYLYPNVLRAHEIRHAAIDADLDKWTDDITAKIAAEDTVGFFRWHDAGDIQSPEHLEAICEVARRLPHINFWLPTKEYDWVAAYPNPFPRNLVVRVSHPMIGKAFKMPFETKGGSVCTSSVGAGHGYLCPAKEQDGKCGDCRTCWSGLVVNVDYYQH